MPSFSIIIPTKNRVDLLTQCVSSIERHVVIPSPDWYEIIIVDTGGIGATEWEQDGGLRVISCPGGTFAQAVNAGVAAHWEGNGVVLLNDDIILQDNILAAFAQAALLHPDAIIGARLLYPDGLVQHGGVGFDQDGAPYNLWRLAPAEHPEVIKRRVLPAVTFACAMIPRVVWEEVGGLDDRYTNAFEDVDFCLKARELGHTVIYDPSVCAVHLEGQSSGRHDGIEASWRHFQEVWLATNRIRYVLGVWPFSAVRR